MPVAMPLRHRAIAHPAIAIDQVTVAYGPRVALADVTVGFGPGELVSLLGPNGSGKSTLLKACVGLTPVTGGSVRVLGESIPRGRAEIAYVPQRELVDWDFPVTVKDVVMMGRTARLGWLRWPGKVDHELVHHALAQVRLLDRANAQIGELSGGQQQRVFLARALTQQAKILLLDEPFTGIDAASQAVILDILQAIAANGRTVVMATHDIETAAQISDRVVLLKNRVIAQGEPAAVVNPDLISQTYCGYVLRGWR